MSRGRSLSALVIAGLVIVSAWWMFGGRAPAAADGQVLLTWSGSQPGRARLPGTISWCPVTRNATLEAISADTGLLISLFEADSISPEVHPVLAPAMRAQMPRPGAIVGLRWVEDTVAIRGYQSVSGVVNLREVGALVSGEAEIRMRAAAGADTLVVRADFSRLPVVASAVGCP